MRLQDTCEVTLGELVRFVLENRRGKAFGGYTEETIAWGIYTAARRGTMRYATKPDSREVCGIVVCDAQDDDKLMYVHDILTTEPWVLKAFVRAFAERWPEYHLAGMRYGKRMNYRTGRFCNLVKGMN
jgi:hypothetical protein